MRSGTKVGIGRRRRGGSVPGGADGKRAGAASERGPRGGDAGAGGRAAWPRAARACRTAPAAGQRGSSGACANRPSRAGELGEAFATWQRMIDGDVPDRARARRLDGERRARPARGVARRARLRRPRRLHVRERHRGPPRAARRAVPPASTPTTSTTTRSGASGTTASTTTWSARPSTTRWRTSRAGSSSTWRRAGRGPRSAACASCGSSALARRARASAARSRPLARATACRCSCRRRRTARSPKATARRGARGPVVDFFRDYEIALAMMNRYMAPGPGTAAIFLGGGVPKDFIQITATSVSPCGAARPARTSAAIQITTDNPVYGGLGGAGVTSEAISWGKEAADGDNVMVFADVTIALPAPLPGPRSSTTARPPPPRRPPTRRRLEALSHAAASSELRALRSRSAALTRARPSSAPSSAPSVAPARRTRSPGGAPTAGASSCAVPCARPTSSRNFPPPPSAS